MTARRAAVLSLAAPALAALTLAACSPGAPKGVDKDTLDAAISRAIGDPASCLLIAEQASGKLVYRYNSHTACARAWPSFSVAFSSWSMVWVSVPTPLQAGSARAQALWVL